jgi:hypothetical protein
MPRLLSYSQALYQVELWRGNIPISLYIDGKCLIRIFIAPQQ